MELEGQWWKEELAEDIHQALRYKVCIPVTVLVFGAIEHACTRTLHKSDITKLSW